MIRRFICTLILLTTVISAAVSAAQINIVEPYLRALPPGVPNSAAFLVIENPGAEAITLVGAETEIAARAELHNHLSENGVMKMRQVEQIVVPARSKVTLAPGGLHIMLFALKAAPEVGQSIPLTLIFDDGSRITVLAQVRDLREPAQQHHHHHQE